MLIIVCVLSDLTFLPILGGRKKSFSIIIITDRSHLMVTTAKVSVKIQYSWSKDEVKIRNVEKTIVTIFGFRLQSAYSFTFFSMNLKI